MISQTDCDEEPHDMGERTMEIQLPVPRHDDQPQKDKEPKSATSLPTLKSGTPNSTNHSSPNSQPLQKLKVQKNFGDKDIFFAIKWTCGILTVAASIVFGIWAPLSYEATISDNDTDNAIVSVLSDAKDLASTANIIALNALETASEQSEVVGALYNTIGLMGQLAVMEFCYGQQSLSVCSSYLQGADDSLEILIERLGRRGFVALTAGTVTVASSVSATVDPENRGAGPVPNAAATSAPAAAPAAPAAPPASNPGAAAPSEPQFASGAAPTSNLLSATATPVQSPKGSATGTSQSAEKAPRLPVDAVLGIIFGVIGIGGAVLGFVVWRMRRRRMTLLGQ